MLARAGWTPDRRIDPIRITDALKQAGFDVLPIQTEFLTTYGGITLNNCSPRPRSDNTLSFDVLTVLAKLGKSYADLLTVYEAPDSGLACSLIGMTSPKYAAPFITDDDAILMLSETGTVYATVGFGDYLVGRSPDEAIDRICRELPWESLPD